MLNYIWAVMIAIGVIYGALTGNIEAVANGALDSAGEAVQLCITMTGIMALWVGPLFPSFFPVFRGTMRRGNIFPPILLPISWGWAGPALRPG